MVNLSPYQQQHQSTDQASSRGQSNAEFLRVEIDRWSARLREISLSIHDHPELAYHETHAHDVLTTFLIEEGFNVTTSYFLHTAFRAEWSLSSAERLVEEEEEKVVMFQSEYDALPKIGHACGHNLIAISGVAALLFLRSLMIRSNHPGKIVLLGTPAEEGGGGKIQLIEKGAYEGVDVCVMCHPGPGKLGMGTFIGSLAIQTINASYHTESSDGNALDAAVLAYSNISDSRQQMRPDDRVHGIIINGGQDLNSPVSLASLKYFIRSPTSDHLSALRDRVSGCFQGAALSTATRLEINFSTPHLDQRNNPVLCSVYGEIAREGWGYEAIVEDGVGAFSTDFGNVTHVVPSVAISYAIPTLPNGGNHTPLFTRSARSIRAHEETLKTAACLAELGFKVLVNSDGLRSKIRKAFESGRG
ncbi:Peptidase M20, dimerisation domain [Phaffia rhodozyma]|uniref:Peptidase M20 domain-containing protein 2 n=1 Tax=Phaffia rhodozyma TaxID=264483 RepID=A0A0F7SFQ6_PHARH|nr:Peptidase M20, dimerisation domain [Phaffia rhodozyma]